MNSDKNCRQVLHEWISQNPEGWKTRTAHTISIETGLTESNVRDYFEIVMAEREGGVPQDYSGCISSEIRKLLNDNQDVKEVAFRTGATVEDVKAIKEEIDRPRREREAMGGWTRVR